MVKYSTMEKTSRKIAATNQAPAQFACVGADLTLSSFSASALKARTGQTGRSFSSDSSFFSSFLYDLVLCCFCCLLAESVFAPQHSGVHIVVFDGFASQFRIGDVGGMTVAEDCIGGLSVPPGCDSLAVGPKQVYAETLRCRVIRRRGGKSSLMAIYIRIV